MSAAVLGRYLPLPTVEQITHTLKVTTKVAALISNIYFDNQYRNENPYLIQRSLTGPNIALGLASCHFTKLNPLFYLLTAMNVLIYAYNKSNELIETSQNLGRETASFINSFFENKENTSPIYYPEDELKK
ncbi:MAG: hypothetical protein SNF33_01050 [Candidatus Algichlamydia australiensis]|nr:hypothetical protein [Chlamydiales bacterium]